MRGKGNILKIGSYCDMTAIGFIASGEIDDSLILKSGGHDSDEN